MGNNFTPAWIKKGFFNESLFCDDFLSTHQLLYSNGAFFTPEGMVTDTMNLRCEIFDMLRDHIGANIAKRVSNVVDVLKLAAQVEDFPPVTDRIALANGTLYLDDTFPEGKPEIVRNRLPVKYDPKAAQPVHWLRFLSDLLYPEDIPTVQAFIGYCLIPSNKGQRMMVIKGNGGEGKSQIGVVLSRLFGCNMKDGSIGKISENRFARADLEHASLLLPEGRLPFWLFSVFHSVRQFVSATLLPDRFPLTFLKTGESYYIGGIPSKEDSFLLELLQGSCQS